LYLLESKYKPEFCELLVEHMKQGYSFESFGATANTGKDTLLDWCNRWPEFKAAKKEGYTQALKYWEDLQKACTLRRPMTYRNKSGEVVAGSIPDRTMVIFALKTRFHAEWGERLAYKYEPEDYDLDFDFGEIKKDE
jgi:hypothetical protein